MPAPNLAQQTARNRAFASGSTLNVLGAAVLTAALLVALYLTSLKSYLLFHTLAELTFVLIAITVLLVAWNLRAFVDDDFPLFLGVALGSVAILRLLHLLDYKGMGVLDALNPNHSTQLWVAGAVLSAASLVVAPLVIGRRVNAAVLVAIYGLVDAAVLFVTYVWPVFPTAYIEGVGLTTFKKVSEYVVCVLLIAAATLLWRRRRALPPGMARAMLAAFAVWIVSELCFTLYTGVYETPNLIGHLLSVLSALLIYYAVVHTGLAQPHARAVADLRYSERTALAGRREAEAVGEALEELLSLAPSFHSDENYEQIAGHVCSGARRMFECASATLLRAERDGLVVLGSDPAETVRRHGALVAPGEFPGIGDAVAQGRSFYVAEGVGGSPTLYTPIGPAPALAKVLVLTWERGRAEPDRRIHALAQRFADQAGLALVQASRRDAEAQAATMHQRLEASLLPALSLEHSALRISTRYRPTMKGLYLGGDFIDLAHLDDGRVAVLVGDVAGHGPDAAGLGATLRAGWQALAITGVDMPRMAQSLSRVLAREGGSPEAFVTCCIAIVDPHGNEVEVLDLGHPAPFIVGGEVVETDVTHYPPLGLTDGIDLAVSTVALAPEKSLFFYTDGLIEGYAVPGENPRLGSEGLAEIVAEECREGCDAVALDHVLQRVEAANGGPLPDDVAMVTVAPPASVDQRVGVGGAASAAAARRRWVPTVASPTNSESGQ